MAKSCKWSKRDFVSESILLRFAKTILESSFHRFIMQHMSYNWKYKVLHRWELQFNFTIIQLAYFVMDKWTNRPAMLFDIYLQGKWIGFKIDNFPTLNCNFTLVFFQDYYFISTSRPGMLTSLEGGYCAKNNMKVTAHEKYSSYQILGGLLWQIHQTHSTKSCFTHTYEVLWLQKSLPKLNQSFVPFWKWLPCRPCLVFIDLFLHTDDVLNISKTNNVFTISNTNNVFTISGHFQGGATHTAPVHCTKGETYRSSFSSVLTDGFIRIFLRKKHEKNECSLRS